MKKSELKAIIKECVKETILEEGILSEIIAEVALGITKAQEVLLESSRPATKPAPGPRNEEIEIESKLVESKKRMISAIGDRNRNLANVFEGTTPLSTSGQEPGSSQASPLANRAPDDAGVDIGNLFKLAGSKWNKLK